MILFQSIKNSKNFESCQKRLELEIKQFWLSHWLLHLKYAWDKCFDVYLFIYYLYYVVKKKLSLSENFQWLNVHILFKFFVLFTSLYFVTKDGIVICANDEHS